MKLVMIGQGGHSKVLADIARMNNQIKIIGYFDDKFSAMTTENNVFFSPLSQISKLYQRYSNVEWVVAIGDNYLRNNIVKKLAFPIEKYTRLIHPSAIISPSAEIGSGTVIMPNVVINAGVKIGDHVIVNTGAIIEHDSNIEDFVHISPNTTITGSVVVKQGAHIGANATVIPGKVIGEWAVIGAGSTVIDSIAPFITAVGVPAKAKTKAGDNIVEYKV